MRITVVGSFPPSQVFLNEHTAHMVRGLARLPGVETTVIADAIGERAETEDLSRVTLRRCWRHNHLPSLPRILWHVWRSRPDVVWFNLVITAFSDRPVGAFLAATLPALTRLLGLNTVVTMHALLESIDPAGTKHQKHWAVKRAFGVLAQKLIFRAHVVFAFLDDYVAVLRERYGARAEKSWHGFEDGDSARPHVGRGARILVFGRFGGYKRLDFAIEAFRALRARMPHAAMTIAGSSHPSYPGYFEDTRARHAAEPGLSFRGYVPEDELEALFHGHDVVFLPYASNTGVSGVAHRACRFGMPLVMPALPDFLAMARDNGFAAETYPVGDAEAAAAALRDVLEDPAIRRSLAERNAAAANARPTHLVIEAHVQLFRHIFALAPEAGGPAARDRPAA